MRDLGCGSGMSAIGNRYDVVETVRSGQDATLERAVRKRDGRRVLLKILLHARPFDVEQLRNELALGSILNLPCVVRPLELDEVNGLPALVREDADGVPLDRILGAPLGVEPFLTIAIQIARAVENMHRHSIVHRLLKPESLFVNQTAGEVKISEFGIAFKLARVPSATQFPGLVESALSHMSPEQTGRVNRVTDTRSDLARGDVLPDARREVALLGGGSARMDPLPHCPLAHPARSARALGVENGFIDHRTAPGQVDRGQVPDCCRLAA
jgi:serine/threonine protein kinase